MSKPRTLVLCFDGTADQYAGKNTNVVKLYSLLKKDDSEQLCYYQPGIGTYFNSGVVSPFFQWGAKILDQCVAWYLDAHVRGGYQFLMQNYHPGDKICLFGFSRGAYTARALAGMLHKIGLLPRDNPEQIPFAYKLYKRTDADSVELAAGFKQTFCRDVQIEFVGVWDTVASVGTLVSRRLPFIANNTTIRTFRHALSLDEHRARFRPNLYHRPSPSSEAKADRKENVTTPHEVDQEGSQKLHVRRASQMSLRQWTNLPSRAANLRWGADEEKTEEPAAGTDVLEVWFAGCHCDVGGSAVEDSVKLSLSHITLRWMVRQIMLAQCGITFDDNALRRLNIPPSVVTGIEFPITPPQVEKRPQTSSSSGSDAERPDTLDKMNALQPLHDELYRRAFWWILEVLPMSYNWQEKSGKWRTSWCIHFAKGRHLPEHPSFHVTVKERMNDKALQYHPRAIWKSGTEVYVD
ncbi:hypothetical protein WOLCODRAFT_98323 [Wolfiporia cocos MD-104 SS10]|uniref:T6SS Phospholipase effector Tle1-like catalytic domain-containing protein n=1 Tax=Wolfiporia cocos (strain MD-104) TaxID=742152 RepID=A0A2H3JTT7_WOLCO|nr:hypothetical protein WOLCODRAFT_98323 [Wolfiporia cocos MD-104 SS10]